MTNAPSGEPDSNAPQNEPVRLRAALPKDVRANLDAVESSLRVSLRIRGKNGRPSMAVIQERCPLCVAAVNRTEVRDLRKRSAVILLPSLRLRCDGVCAAGEAAADVDERPVGLPWNEWRREFPDLERSTTAIADEAPEAIAKMTASGRFFVIENATVFVSALRAEPIRVSDKGAFPAIVAEVVGIPQRSTRFKEVLPTVIDHAHRTAQRATAEYVVGRGQEGSLLVHLGAGSIARCAGGGYTRAANGDAGIVFSTEADFQPLAFKEFVSLELCSSETRGG